MAMPTRNPLKWLAMAITNNARPYTTDAARTKIFRRRLLYVQRSETWLRGMTGDCGIRVRGPADSVLRPLYGRCRGRRTERSDPGWVYRGGPPCQDSRTSGTEAARSRCCGTRLALPGILTGCGARP